MIRLNPVFQKEYMLMTRSIKMIVTVLIFNAILSIFGFAVFYSIINTAKYTGVVDYSSMLNLYYVMAFIEFVMVALIVPAISSGAISGEREKQTLDILLTTRMTPLKIVTGKLMSSIITIMLLIISSFPILALIFAFGGVSLSQLMLMALIMIVSAGYIGSISIMYSAVLKRTSSAGVASYGTVMGIYVGILVIVVGIYLIKTNILANSETIKNYNLSGLAFLLLIDPAFTFFSWLTELSQVDYNTTTALNALGIHSELVINNWITISMFVQLLISLLAIKKAESALKPAKKQKIRKNRR
ncbi:MAG: ABC transporter permease subunit [Lachnospiraceae bacterium]|uniref:ABC transporter permease n=1 Tax=Falcatimonas sp. MSJ-15 TaxID=2841515 RepID=UPI001C11DAD5|nr:ABC transporter permease subunit [Falcatimonas sp. MSJ-15]MBQ5735321.1 hypothetical protein [Lachnospiraceae bacterium]MBU5468810.1 ABC transporter permease [Falcatimonas sp. MSJ-15]MEE0960830.1 ABC transporter permease subunit [Lachnospiraceae bacterium]